MKAWYSDSQLGIFFDITPKIGIRYAKPTMTDSEIESVKKYPFVNKEKLTVRLIDNIKQKTYEFDIPKGYCFDGASVPRFFWRIIGAPTDNEFLIAALVHDVMCENHSYIMNDRKFSTEVFNALLKVSKVSKVKRFLMVTGINIYQKFFCDWGLEWGK